MSRRRARPPSLGTVLATLGVIGTLLGIIGFVVSDLPNLFGGNVTPGDTEIVNTLAALERDKLQAEFQLTQIVLEDLQAANHATQQAIAEQQANIQATLDAAEKQQADVVATSNAVAALTATVDSANAQATEVSQNATATANFLAQLTPTSTPVPTQTAVPAPVADYRSLQSADVALTGGNLLFAMRVAQPILEQPQEGLAYVWALDTDRNPETGLSLEDIGVDAQVEVIFADGAWLGTVSIIQPDGSVGETFRFLDIEINGPNLFATLDPVGLGLPTTFDWSARVELGTETYPSFPESGHASLG